MRVPALVRDWRAKALLQQALSHLPGGERVNFALQHRVTGLVPVSDERLIESWRIAGDHLAAYARWGGKEPAVSTFLEFGAGWDLRMPLMFRLLGVGHQIVVDVRPLARAWLVDDVLERIATLDGLEPDQRRSAEEMAARAESAHGSIADKLAPLGIEYRAPVDMRRTELGQGSIDCITCTSTLEHIPAEDLDAILRECRRMLRPHGLLSCVIDYSDHFSHFDPTITPYNFLRFSERRWRVYNSTINSQNRLRHSDYLARARAAGLTVLDAVSRRPDATVGLEREELDGRFRHYELEDLRTTYAHLVLH